MSIILHFTDPHITASTPDHPSPRRWRSSSYERDILTKLEWISKRAVEFDDDDSDTLVWCTGDVFDRAVEPIKTTLRFADWLGELRHHAIPFFLTLGQHDVRGYNLSTADECSAGVLWRIPEPPKLMRSQYETTSIFGVECASVHAGADHLLSIRNPKEIADCAVVGTHLNIHPNAYGCVAPKDIHWEDTTLCLCSHIHQGFPACQHSGTWFSAPGALCRLNADELERKPQISVIHMDGPEVLSVEYETVPHRPVEEVFDLEAMNQVQETQRERTLFREAIGDVSMGEAASVGDWRASLEAAREQAGNEVVVRLMEYCERVG